MGRVSAAEANRNFAKIMQRARDGETIVVTSHGEPAVTILKYQPGGSDDAEKARLDAAWQALWSRIDTQPATGRRWDFNRDELYDD